MRITAIDAYGLSSPIEPPQEHPFHGGTRTIRKRDVVLATVETADGEVGYAPGGASSSAMREYFRDATHDNLVDVIRTVVAPTLEGEEIDGIDEVHEAIRGINLPEFVLSQAASVIDIALHDIVGKRRGAPVYELLGDEESITRDLPLYASGGMYMSPEGYAEEAASLHELGFTGYKYRPGIGPEADRETIRRIREAVGDDMAVMADAHTWWKMGERSYTFEQIRDLVRAFEEHDVYWVEEPLSPQEGYDRYLELGDLVDAPLAAGENEESVGGLVELGESGAVSFLQGDVRHHSGFTGCWSAVERCRDLDVAFVPHNFGTHLGLVANAHLVAAAPGRDLLEYPAFETDDHRGMYPFPLATDILRDDLDVGDGTLAVPDGPGLGVDVDLDVVESYPFLDGPWTEFHYEAES